MAKSLNEKKQTELKRIIQNLSTLYQNKNKIRDAIKNGVISICIKISVYLIVAIMLEPDDEVVLGKPDVDEEIDIIDVLDSFDARNSLHEIGKFLI